MSDLPITTLFMLMSVDGKISTGVGDDRDFDKDLPNSAGVSEGLQQYYDLEMQTDLWSLNTGKVMAKVGWNEDKTEIKRIPVTFVIVDSRPHLTALGVMNLLKHSARLIIATTNQSHPARSIRDGALSVMQYKGEIDFQDLFTCLKKEGADRLTVQSGGEMNAELVRDGLIDYVSIVTAPVLVGGKNTPTLVDGKSLESAEDLKSLRSLRLVKLEALKDSYVHLQYQVDNS